VLRGPLPPSERAIHGTLYLRGGRHPQRDRDHALAFPAPYSWRQAYGEGPVLLRGTVEQVIDLPPGGSCTVQLAASAERTTTPPHERGGKLILHDLYSGDAFTQGFATRTTNPDGTTTWLTAPDAEYAHGWRAEPDPPRGHTASQIEATVTSELDRFGPATEDGYPALEPTPQQQATCTAAATAAATTVLPHALAGARIVHR
jgi:hypothetical protein